MALSPAWIEERVFEEAHWAIEEVATGFWNITRKNEGL